MPLIDSDYQVPFYLSNPHASTIVPSMFRKVAGFTYNRERLELPDGDFLDLDWVKQGSRKLVILSHGLEGNSGRGYMRGTAGNFYRAGWDVLAWNCRSCSGEINRLARFYHHADTQDIKSVIEHGESEYDEVLLVGYSMGGSISLNYLGSIMDIPASVIGAVVFSVPVVLYSSVTALSEKGNGFYRKRFMEKLKAKMKTKAEMFPDQIDVNGIDSISYFEEYDNRFTAPLHGFRDADHFYHEGSALPRLRDIEKPVLIVNAIDDPFLGEECYPYDLCEALTNVYLETPGKGGHVGFPVNRRLESFMDFRALEFYQSYIRH
jgi:predicted alpha/beta-fold hydrolase